MWCTLNTKSRPHADVIKAWADGAKIECWDDNRKEWYIQVHPSFWANNNYRVYIEPLRYYRLAEMCMAQGTRYIALVQTDADEAAISQHPEFWYWLTDWKPYDY